MSCFRMPIGRSTVTRRLSRYSRIIRDSLRYEGLGVLAYRVLVKLLSPVVYVDHQILFEYDLAQPTQERQARVANCVSGPATEEDLPSIVDSRIPPLPMVDETTLSDDDDYDRAVAERERAAFREHFRKTATDWMRAGETCFIARVGGELVHSNWMQFPWSNTGDERPIRLLPGEIYMTEGFTSEPWRGKGVHEVVNVTMLRHAKACGIQRAYTITDLTKAGSRRGIRRIGWRYRGHHLFVRPRGLRRTWIVRLGGDIEPILRDTPGYRAHE